MAADQAFILRLPNELLDKIIGLAVEIERDALSDPRIHEPAWALTFVCHRFNGLATPYLYSSLSLRFDYEGSWRRRAKKYLHRSLRKNPALWPLCKDLVISHKNDDPNKTPFKDLYIALDLATWLTATKSLMVMHDGDPRTFREVSHAISRAIECMTALEELTVHDCAYKNISLPLIINDLGNLGIGSSLRRLDLRGVSRIIDTKAWKTLQGLAGTGSITELSLFAFLQKPAVLSKLVAWPSKLEVFQFRFSYCFDYSGSGLSRDWSLGTFRRVLESQKTNLHTIEIRNINKAGLENFELFDFTNLKHMSLSHGSTGNDKTLIANLVAPNLSSFHWDLTLEDQQCCETVDSFGQLEEDWLRALADAATARKARLGSITILFGPEAWARSFDSGEELIYPWDRMDAIARDIKPQGIDFSYNTPTVTRREFRHLIQVNGPKDGLTPLWSALDNGQADALVQLLESGADIEDKCDGRTLLREASEIESASMVKILLDHGACVDAVDKDFGKTSLLVAAEQGTEPVIKLLLDRGADTEIRDYHRRRTPLLAAAELRHIGPVRLLLDKNADINAKDGLEQRTPLIWAAIQDEACIVSELLLRGADATITDGKHGRTALQWAITKGHHSVERLLDGREKPISQVPVQHKEPDVHRVCCTSYASYGSSSL